MIKLKVKGVTNHEKIKVYRRANHSNFKRRKLQERTSMSYVRKHGISTGTYHLWKSKFGNTTVSEARRLKTLELENSKLKRLVADQALDILALKDVVSRKW